MFFSFLMDDASGVQPDELSDCATEVYNDYLSVNSLILTRNDFDWLSCPCDVIT